jgi:HEAT repeat protein
MKKLFAIFLVGAMMSATTFGCAPRGSAAMQEKSSKTSLPQKDFITVKSGSLEARLESALKLARSASPQTSFFVAYRFDVRPDISIDMEVKTASGKVMNFDSISVSSHASNPSRNVGVFLRFTPESREVAEVRVHDFDRKRDFPARVYWLGQAEASESISFLAQIAESDNNNEIAERAVLALAIHNDPRVEDALVKLLRTAQSDKARASAALWLGQFTNRRDVLAGVVRNERESREVRGAATLGIGMSGDIEGMNELQRLFADVSDRSVREHILVAIFSNKNETSAIDFLVKLAGDRTDPGARRQALFWLGQKAGERSSKILRDTIDDTSEETEVQTHAVFAISLRPKDEAVPLLINIAKTHPKAEVRKKAMFWLGQTGDERALGFFKEVLAK